MAAPADAWKPAREGSHSRAVKESIRKRGLESLETLKRSLLAADLYDVYHRILNKMVADLKAW